MHVIYAIKARIYTDDLSCLYRKYSLFPFKYNTPHCPSQSIHLGPSNPTLTWLNCFRSFQFGSEKKPPQVNPFNYHHKKAYSCTELLPKKFHSKHISSFWTNKCQYCKFLRCKKKTQKKSKKCTKTLCIKASTALNRYMYVPHINKIKIFSLTKIIRKTTK